MPEWPREQLTDFAKFDINNDGLITVEEGRRFGTPVATASNNTTPAAAPAPGAVQTPGNGPVALNQSPFPGPGGRGPGGFGQQGGDFRGMGRGPGGPGGGRGPGGPGGRGPGGPGGDWRNMSQEEMARGFISRMDQNGDGKLSPEEGGRMLRGNSFTEADTNRDGFVDAQEWAARMASFAQRGGQGGQRGGRGGGR
jgi:hypothetical protein